MFGDSDKVYAMPPAFGIGKSRLPRVIKIHRILARVIASWALLAVMAIPGAFAQTANFTLVPAGYAVGSIPLPRGFGDALAADPSSDNIIYAAIGEFQNLSLARIDLSVGAVTSIADGPFTSISGLVVLSATQILLIGSAPSVTVATGRTILLLSDSNPQNGNFNDPGEIRELIPPMLATPNWTGNKVRIAPVGNPSAIPTGSILIQTAEGSKNSKLLVLENPLTAPAFHPANAPYFTGFDYGLGFDFDSHGRIMLGAVDISGVIGGKITALVNTNGNETIDSGESNNLLTGGPSFSDLTTDSVDNLYLSVTENNPLGAFGIIQTCAIPSNPLTGTVTLVSFARTDAMSISALAFNSKTRSFAPNAGAGGATLVIGAIKNGVSSAMNLLTLKPQ